MHQQRTPPSWWPADMAWPPRHIPGQRDGRKTRWRFFRRMGCAFLAFLGFIFLGFGLAYWLFARLLEKAQVPADVIIASRWGLAAFILVGVLVVLFVGYNLRRAALPIGRLLEASDKVADGDFAVRVAEQGPPEMRVLSTAFNRMAARLQASDEQRRRLLADVSHELRTPLTILQGNLEGMLDGVYPADPQHLEPLLEETRTLGRVIEDLRVLALAEGGALPLQRESVEPGELLHEALAVFQPRADAAGVRLSLEAGDDLPTVELDPTRLREVLANLLANALRYTPAGGQVQVRCWSEPNRLWFSLRDSGPGIPPEDLERVFDRYYKGAGSPGMGLGLAIARGLVQAHGGEIHAESHPGQGTTMVFWIPS